MASDAREHASKSDFRPLSSHDFLERVGRARAALKTARLSAVTFIAYHHPKAFGKISRVLLIAAFSSCFSFAMFSVAARVRLFTSGNAGTAGSPPDSVLLLRDSTAVTIDSISFNSFPHSASTSRNFPRPYRIP